MSSTGLKRQLEKRAVVEEAKKVAKAKNMDLSESIQNGDVGIKWKINKHLIIRKHQYAKNMLEKLYHVGNTYK